jgi:hypothetical protein
VQPSPAHSSRFHHEFQQFSTAQQIPCFTRKALFNPGMILEHAAKLIKDCADRMNAVYGKAVFDEWALISLEGSAGKILAYTGPRREDFQKNFISDLGALRAGLLGEEHAVGEFEFARHAIGTSFEAFLVAGEGVYLLCNNTELSMAEITADSKWLQAQVYFADLADAFHKNPLFIP